ncbi:glycosyl transferase family protein [Emcibacter nanhaiensis]|nr:glycosyl transferase family protein [Emcibacter nanhaiensis]
MAIDFLLVLKLLFYPVAGLILVSSLDDLFIDLCYHIRTIWRRLYTYQRHPAMQHPDLRGKGEQPFAVLIPCWQEADVIRNMLENTLRTYEYHNYHLFVGIYPNDPDSAAEVEHVARQYSRVHACPVPRDGPTDKADCLNATLQRVWEFERENDLEFTGFVLHDAEDIIHPLELKLFNHLIDRKDMIQLPVIPLERPLGNLTGGHYLDEFAENHCKELVVREALTGLVPSAGVGCAFSRRAFRKLQSRGDVFRSGSLTEDYDLALRLGALGCSEIFVRFPQKARDGRSSLIATREYFPDTVRGVVRQKSRWLIGIVFQAWRRRKWPGSLAFRYILFRDRKGFFTAWLNMAAYLLLLGVLLYWSLSVTVFANMSMPPLMRRGEPLEYLLWINLVLLLNRALHSVAFCYHTYGPACAALSLPRQVWGNVLNFLAGFRAFRLYSLHLLTGRPLSWDKTAHQFPDAEELAPLRLGDMMLQQQLITWDDLDKALLLQRTSPLPLGRILLAQQLIDQAMLDRLLTDQTRRREQSHADKA